MQTRKTRSNTSRNSMISRSSRITKPLFYEMRPEKVWSRNLGTSFSTADQAPPLRCEFSARKIYFSICGTQALKKLKCTGHLIFSMVCGGQSLGPFQSRPGKELREEFVEYIAGRI